MARRSIGKSLVPWNKHRNEGREYTAVLVLAITAKWEHFQQVEQHI